MTDDRGERPGKTAPVPASGTVSNVFQKRLAHARATAVRLRLSPQATAALEAAVSHEPYVLETGILEALSQAGFAERAAMMMPYAAEGPDRHAHALGHLAGGALAAQAGNTADAERWLAAAERAVSARPGTVHYLRLPQRVPSARHAGTRRPGFEPEM
jgi:hypothetical protein